MSPTSLACILGLAVLASAFDIPHIGSIDGDARPSVTEEILTPRTFKSWAEAFASKGVQDVLLNIPPRRMWGWSGNVDGYCGETSIQSMGLYYGNYVSQELVRYADGNSELLVGINDAKALKALKYSYEEWDFEAARNPQEKAFKAWIKSNLDQGYPVTAGFYLKEQNGDPDYDHIMVIVGYTVDSQGNMNGLYHNDYYQDVVSLTSATFATRSKCTMKSPKQPFDYCLPVDVDYGVAVFGIVDPLGETYRATLATDMWDEPDWGAEDKLHQKPILFASQLTVSGLTKGNPYTCLRFDDATSLPAKGNFLSGSWDARFDFVANSTTAVVDVDPVMSDGQYFYRCVDA